MNAPQPTPPAADAAASPITATARRGWRRWLRVGHRWLAIVSGLLIAVITLSGGALLFREPLDHALEPALHAATPGRVPIDAVLAAARASQPEGKPRLVLLASAERPTHRVRFAGTPTVDVYVDPGTGTVLGTRRSDETPAGALADLHIRLFAGKTGHAVVGAVGIALLVLLVSGFALSWPRQKERLVALHRRIGLVTLPLLALGALTGVGMAYGDTTRSLLRAVTGSPPPAPPKAAKEGEPSLDALVASARAALPGTEPSAIGFPTKAGDAFTVRALTPGEWHHVGRSLAWFDRDGSLLSARPLAARDGATRAYELLFPLHTGGYGGWWATAIHLVASLVPTFLLATGVWLWWRRPRRRPSAP